MHVCCQARLRLLHLEWVSGQIKVALQLLPRRRDTGMKGGVAVRKAEG